MGYNISIIKEKNENEKRVILLPEQVKVLVDIGNKVYVEKGAGFGVGINDEVYERAGAIIVDENEAWTSANIVLKYKAPNKNEYRFFRKGLIIIALFHAEGNFELLQALRKAEVTAYSFEFFEADGYFPLAIPGGELAGKIGLMYGMYYMQNFLGGKGVFPAKIRNATPANIAIIGYGNVGTSVIKMAADLGNNVTVFGRNVNRMNKLALAFGDNVKFVECTRENLINTLKDVDILIGSILISTFDTEAIIDDEMFKLIPPGSVVVDITCGYGKGYLPQIEGYTTFEAPAKIIDSKVCIKIDKLPSAYHKTIVEAYSRTIFPYVLKIVSGTNDEAINSGKIFDSGNICHKEILKHWNYYEKNKL